jgi:predicted GNAT family acetyltransferase
MDIIHDPEDYRFFAIIADDEAELTYTYPEDTIMDFDYTYVPESVRKQGLADQLVQAGLDFAQQKNYKVIPSCPVVEAFVKRHPEYQELIIEDEN